MQVSTVAIDMQESWFDIYKDPIIETQKVIDLFNLYRKTNCPKGCNYGKWMHIIESQLYLHPEIMDSLEPDSYKQYKHSKEQLLEGALQYFQTKASTKNDESVEEFLSIVILSGKQLEMYNNLQIVKSLHSIPDDFMPIVFVKEKNSLSFKLLNRLFPAS